MPQIDKEKVRSNRSRLSRRDRESRMQRFILLTGTIVIVAVVGLVGTGYYFTTYRPLHQTAMIVNGTEFDMAYYVSALKFFGSGQTVTELLQQNELVRQAAEKLGVTVTDEEAAAEVENRQIPVNNTNITFIKAELLVNKILDEYFDDKIPNSAVQRETLAMFLEDEKQAQAVRARIEAGEDFKTLASELSLDKNTKDASGYLDFHPNGTLSSMVSSAVIDDYVFQAEIGALSEPLEDKLKQKSTGYWLMKVVEREDDIAHTMVMLLPNKAAAEAARARLEAGEDFVTVGKEVSHMPGASENGGDIGFINKGNRGPLFDSYIFAESTEIGAVSEPIYDTVTQTRSGYWLIKVLSEDPDKTLSQQDRNAIKSRTYYEWVSELWKNPDNKIETLVTPEQIEWAKEQSKKG